MDDQRPSCSSASCTTPRSPTAGADAHRQGRTGAGRRPPAGQRDAPVTPSGPAPEEVARAARGRQRIVGSSTPRDLVVTGVSVPRRRPRRLGATVGPHRAGDSRGRGPSAGKGAGSPAGYPSCLLTARERQVLAPSPFWLQGTTRPRPLRRPVTCSCGGHQPACMPNWRLHRPAADGQRPESLLHTRAGTSGSEGHG